MRNCEHEWIDTTTINDVINGFDSFVCLHCNSTIEKSRIIEGKPRIDDASRLWRTYTHA
jgi:hypothetical protein